jgi:hypothetical protein
MVERVAKALFKSRSTLGIPWSDLAPGLQKVWLAYATALLDGPTPEGAWQRFTRSSARGLSPERLDEVRFDHRVAKDFLAPATHKAMKG